MSTRIRNESISGHVLVLLLGLIVLAACNIAVAAAAETGSDESRTSISQHHVSGGRDKPTDVTETTEDYPSLITSGERGKSDTRGGFAKPGNGSVEAKGSSTDFWIFMADVILFNDDDNDGYFRSIDLLFDADTIWTAADVYAVVYLSLEGGPWNEYAVTEDFTIFGASAADEYGLVTDLMSGYPSGSYDLLIELFDAVDGTFLTSYGPDETSELAFLPLEDASRDAPAQEVRIVVNRGGGGAIDGWFLGGFLLLLFASEARKIWRQRNDTLMRIDSPAPFNRSGRRS